MGNKFFTTGNKHSLGFALIGKDWPVAFVEEFVKNSIPAFGNPKHEFRAFKTGELWNPRFHNHIVISGYIKSGNVICPYIGNTLYGNINPIQHKALSTEKMVDFSQKSLPNVPDWMRNQLACYVMLKSLKGGAMKVTPALVFKFACAAGILFKDPA
jgi:hypothetical protein